jgi:hypothetical protein
MNHIADDPAQLVVLAFPSTDACDHAFEDLRDLRLHAQVHVDALGQLARREHGEFVYSTDGGDEHTFPGVLLAIMADILVGKAEVDPVHFTVSAPERADARRAPVKRIDRGIVSVGFKQVRAAIAPGAAAIVALARKSAATELVEAIHAMPALSGARRLWLDLHTDLDLLITDVLGAHVAVSPALLSDERAHPPALMGH